ncbi:MAG: MoaD/ThiS family protein [Planctomycetes bacterium]|nr:MoaD/ThiS family protein [Planctomycetota bacterium]
MSALRVEFYGVARSRTGRDALVLEVPEGATLGDALERLAAVEPQLLGAVIAAGGRRLSAGSAASLDGKRFVSDPAEPLPPGVPLLLLPATAGG